MAFVGDVIVARQATLVGPTLEQVLHGPPPAFWRLRVNGTQLEFESSLDDLNRVPVVSAPLSIDVRNARVFIEGNSGLLSTRPTVHDAARVFGR